MTQWMEGDWPEEMQPEDDRDALLKRASAQIRSVMQSLSVYIVNDSASDAIAKLEELADEIDGYYEDDDPRSMGWVGCDGLP